MRFLYSLRGKKRSWLRGKHTGRGHIPNRVDILERISIVELKRRIGDLEGDTIIGLGHRSDLFTIVDRFSKYLCIRRVEDLKSSTVCGEIIDVLSPYSGRVHTITFDNGKEFSEHERISASIGASVYFARPYRSCDRVLVDHTNGLIREYFPKGTDFRKVSDEEVQRVEGSAQQPFSQGAWLPSSSLGFARSERALSWRGLLVSIFVSSVFGPLRGVTAFGRSVAGLRRRLHVETCLDARTTSGSLKAAFRLGLRPCEPLSQP